MHWHGVATHCFELDAKHETLYLSKRSLVLHLLPKALLSSLLHSLFGSGKLTGVYGLVSTSSYQQLESATKAVSYLRIFAPTKRNGREVRTLTTLSSLPRSLQPGPCIYGIGYLATLGTVQHKLMPLPLGVLLPVKDRYSNFKSTQEVCLFCLLIHVHCTFGLRERASQCFRACRLCAT